MSSSEDLHPSEAISAYVDGALDPQEKARVEEHLRSCPRCLELVEDYRALAATAASEEPPPLPPDLLARVRRRIEEERLPARGRRPKTQPWRIPIALAAAGVTVATLVWLAVRQQMPDPSAFPIAILEKEGARKNAPATPSSPPEAKLSGTSKAERENSDAIMVEMGRSKSLDELNSKNSRDAAKKQEPQNDARPREDQEVSLPPSGPTEARPSSRYEEGVASGAPEAGVAAGRLGNGDSKSVAGGTLQGSARNLEGKESSRPMAKAKSDPRPSRQSLLVTNTAGPRSILFETPDATVTLAEEGVITLILRGYACSVNVAAQQSEGGKLIAPPELETLFNRAASLEVAAAATRTEAPDASQQEKEARSKTLTLRDPGGSIIYKLEYGDSPEVAAPRPILDLEAEIRQTVWSRFRHNLEQRCGPVPGAAENPSP